MNFYEFFGIEAGFFIDQVLLKKEYLKKSRDLHPDMNIDAEESQEIFIAQSAYNNEAFKTLSNDLFNLKYLLSINDYDVESTTMSEEFLLEMMDLNEAVMEAAINQNLPAITHLESVIQDLAKDLKEKAAPVLKSFHPDLQKSEKLAIFEAAGNYYLKMNYIKRLQSNLKGAIEI